LWLLVLGTLKTKANFSWMSADKSMDVSCWQLGTLLQSIHWIIEVVIDFSGWFVEFAMEEWGA
jgi:hypothetical protein